jgi:cytochrome c oxidase subunit 2
VSHDALAPAGAQAARIGGLFGLFLWVSVAILVLVLGFTLWAVLRRRSRTIAPTVELPPSTRGEAPPERDVVPPDPARERRAALGVGIATGVSVAILFVLLVGSVVTGRAMARFGRGAAVVVEVTGHQWWWQVIYRDAQADRIVTTANEVHVPVGRPVKLVLTSRDVIHSFWVPSLHGKMDLIPGKQNEITIQADAPGQYRGQCAEFCGYAHAKMGLVVVAEDEASFRAWLEAQRRPAQEPRSAEARRGREVFLSTSCVLCHTVRGTIAGATTGPDLTHLASRLTLGAGAIPRTRGHLQGWVANPQSVKPGALMPPTALPAADLQALVTWLEELE